MSDVIQDRSTNHDKARLGVIADSTYLTGLDNNFQRTTINVFTHKSTTTRLER